MAQEHGGDLEGKARRTIERYGMLAGGERVVVSVSGGPDSVALLTFLNDLAPEMRLTLSVFHLDHMIRGEESREDAEFVQRLAERMGLESSIIEVDVRGSAGKGRSPQDAARIIRLENLLDFAERWGADKVAVGHTADDQVETFLMRVVQGAGLTGLAGIGPVSGKIIRPLIDCWRFDVEDYLARKDVLARLDRTNMELAYLRNRVRLKLIPCFVSEFGEAVKDVIRREVESLAVDREMFQGLSRAALEEAGTTEQDEVHLDRQKLLALSPSLQRGVIREAWGRLRPNDPMLGWRHVADISEKVVLGSTGAAIDLPRNTVAEREYDDVVLRPREPLEPPLPQIELAVPGSVELPGGIVLEAKYVRRGEVAFHGDGNVEYARPDVELPLRVRGPLPGDRFRPLGVPYQRKLKDFFIDNKLPRRERRMVPIVMEGDNIVWVAGHRLDDRYKVRESDERALMLRLGRSG